MTILVTGAAGFIGSHIVDALVEAGARACGRVDALLPVAHAARPDYLDPPRSGSRATCASPPWPSRRSPG